MRSNYLAPLRPVFAPGEVLKPRNVFAPPLLGGEDVGARTARSNTTVLAPRLEALSAHVSNELHERQEQRQSGYDQRHAGCPIHRGSPFPPSPEALTDRNGSSADGADETRVRAHEAEA